MNLIVKIAAAFLLAACGAAVLMFVTRRPGQPPAPAVSPLPDLARGTDGTPALPVKSTAPAVARQSDPAPAPQPPTDRPPVANQQPQQPQPVPPAPPAVVKDNAITGVVKLDGKAPPRKPIVTMAAVRDCAVLHRDPPLEETVVADDAGNLANVVVFLTGGNLPRGAVPKEPAVLSQKGCQYVPHVLDVTVGQAVEARNDDGFLHNVHTLPEANEPSNMAQPTKQTDKLKMIKFPELIKVKCDVHPWMTAWVYAFDHPYHATTDDTGAFEIRTDGLPDGQYAIVAWHEKYKQSPPQVVTIKGGKPAKPVTFTFKP